MLRLLCVGSKRFLTSKVDRSVMGLIARQQCCGPLHLPLSDVAVFAQSPFSTTGCATAIGEQPVKGLIDPAAMGRLTVGEACTNLVWAAITDIEAVKCSGNWMWASKLEGEGAAMYDCCEAMGAAMLELGIAVDGGKDSLSMAAKVGEEVVKAPGTLVVSVYAGCPDISLTVTPDIKHAGRSSLVLVDLSGGHARLGTGADLQAAGRRDARLRHGAAEARLPRDPASAARACAVGGPRPFGWWSADEGAGDVLRR